MRTTRSVLILAIVFILAGTVLTLENTGIISGFSRLWPLFLLITGAGFMILFSERKKVDLALLFVGTVLTLMGVFFLYLNFTSWSETATHWPVFLAIGGGGFGAVYAACRIRLFLFLALGLVLIAGVFYLVFMVSKMLWPLSLVAFGVSLLLVNHFYLKR
jgi:hypothetical protein